MIDRWIDGGELIGEKDGGKDGNEWERCYCAICTKINKKIDKSLCNNILHILPNNIYIRGVKVKKPKTQNKRGNIYEEYKNRNNHRS